jgi:PP-loop superfamily ATP-utilizing enzyme
MKGICKWCFYEVKDIQASVECISCKGLLHKNNRCESHKQRCYFCNDKYLTGIVTKIASDRNVMTMVVLLSLPTHLI